MRTVGHPAFEKVLRRLAEVKVNEHSNPKNARGLTKDIRTGPLEKLAEARVEAKLSDDAPVDYSLWALLEETPEEERARHVLRRFAVKWWAANIEKEARTWLENHDHDQRDVDAVEDIIRRAKGASYWEWHRGSRLFFWRFQDEEWRIDARDGVEFFKTEKPPTGLFPNIPSESRDAELATRKKIFKLWFRRYLEEGPVKLVIPRFSIVKTRVEDVVTDIRVIWDCKRMDTIRCYGLQDLCYLEEMMEKICLSSGWIGRLPATSWMMLTVKLITVKMKGFTPSRSKMILM